MAALGAPEASLIAASLVFVVGSASLTQKARNDRRDAWWKRAQWAIDKALSDDSLSRQIGTDSLDVLIRAPGRSRHDLQIILAAAARALDRSVDAGDDVNDIPVEGEIGG